MKQLRVVAGLVFCAFSGLLSFGNGLARAEGTLPLSGTLQLWSKACRTAVQCDLPVATTEPHSIEAQAAGPVAGQPSSYVTEWTANGVSVKLGVFQKAPDTRNPTSYTSYQVSVFDQASGKLLVECSSFEPLQSETWFPVGACSWAKAGTDDYQRFGVTFRRKVLPFTP